jgi:Na+/H+ antiporter NhaD/arsenite permease-like protein
MDGESFDFAAAIGAAPGSDIEVEMAKLVSSAIEEADNEDESSSAKEKTATDSGPASEERETHSGNNSARGSARPSFQSFKNMFSSTKEKGLQERNDLHPDLVASVGASFPAFNSRHTKHSHSGPSRSDLQLEPTLNEDGPSTTGALLSHFDDLADDEVPEDEAFDVMVGSCPFLDSTITAFVRLQRAEIVGELAEEGYRTRDLFLCLGPEDESEDIWQIGRSFAILMSEQSFAERIDSCETKEQMINVVDSFIDQSVIIPKMHVDIPEDHGNNHPDSDAESTDGSTASHDGSNHDALSAASRRRSTRILNNISTREISASVDSNTPKSGFGRFLAALGLGEDEAAAAGAVVQVEIPQHVVMQQRRRQRIAEERRRQLQKFAVTEDSDAYEIPNPWGEKEKRSLIGISIMSLFVIVLLIAWVGPAMAKNHSGHHPHMVHMHGFAGEVGGLIAISKDHDYEHYLDKEDKTSVFDMKAIIQFGSHEAEAHRRRLEATEEDFRRAEASDDPCDHETCVYVEVWDSNADEPAEVCYSFKKTIVDSTEEIETLQVLNTADSSFKCSISDEKASQFYFRVSTNSETPVALVFQVDCLGSIARYRTVLSALLLVGVYFCIVTDVVHRTLVAMIGSFLALLLLACMDYHASMQTAVVWLDEGTLGLLFGMMILVNLVSTTGLFEFVAIRALDMSGGYLARLLVLLCIATAVLSAFLDNVTTMLLLAPVTIELCKVIETDPIPFLISEVMFSNIGGTATMIGDPPNIIIGNMLSGDVGFVDFIVNLMPCILLAAVPSMFFLLWYFKSSFPAEPKQFDIAMLRKKYPITDPVLLAKSGVILGSVLVMFFLHPLHHIDTAWVACMGAVALMTIATPHELHQVFESVEWDTLLFFAALFVMIEALATMGLIRSIGEGLTAIISTADDDSRLVVAMIVVLWVSAIVSGFLDNIPYTATMVPVVEILANDPDMKLPLKPLVWALSLGACLGGNLTLVGASANLVTAGISEHGGHPITFLKFMKVGAPITFITVICATVYCTLVYQVMGIGN